MAMPNSKLLYAEKSVSTPTFKFSVEPARKGMNKTTRIFGCRKMNIKPKKRQAKIKWLTIFCSKKDLMKKKNAVMANSEYT
jgi:hypothetical protein